MATPDGGVLPADGGVVENQSDRHPDRCKSDQSALLHARKYFDNQATHDLLAINFAHVPHGSRTIDLMLLRLRERTPCAPILHRQVVFLPVWKRIGKVRIIPHRRVPQKDAGVSAGTENRDRLWAIRRGPFVRSLAHAARVRRGTNWLRSPPDSWG